MVHKILIALANEQQTDQASKHEATDYVWSLSYTETIVCHTPDPKGRTPARAFLADVNDNPHQSSFCASSRLDVIYIRPAHSMPGVFMARCVVFAH